MNFRYKGASPSQKAIANREYAKRVKETAQSTMSINLVQNFLGVVCEVLHTKYGFGDKRLNDFKDEVEKVIDAINTDYLTFDDLKKYFNLEEVVIVGKDIIKLDDKMKAKIKRKVG